MRVNILASTIATLVVIGLLVGMVSVTMAFDKDSDRIMAESIAAEVNAKIEAQAESKATGTHTAIEPNTFERSQKYTILWGNSTDVEHLLTPLPMNFTPEAIDWYQWDSSQCYDDGEILSIIVSTFTAATNLAAGSISVYRDEIKTNDGCENAATSEFVLVGQF